MRFLLLPAALAAAGSLACATPAPPAPPPAPSVVKPEVRCRTVLDVRPGTLGAPSSATPVERCEPVAAPAAAAVEAPPEDEAPLGSTSGP